MMKILVAIEYIMSAFDPKRAFIALQPYFRYGRRSRNAECYSKEVDRGYY